MRRIIVANANNHMDNMSRNGRKNERQKEKKNNGNNNKCSNTDIRPVCRVEMRFRNHCTPHTFVLCENNFIFAFYHFYSTLSHQLTALSRSAFVVKFEFDQFCPMTDFTTTNGNPIFAICIYFPLPLPQPLAVCCFCCYFLGLLFCKFFPFKKRPFSNNKILSRNICCCFFHFDGIALQAVACFVLVWLCCLPHSNKSNDSSLHLPLSATVWPEMLEHLNYFH